MSETHREKAERMLNWCEGPASSPEIMPYALIVTALEAVAHALLATLDEAEQ